MRLSSIPYFVVGLWVGEARCGHDVLPLLTFIQKRKSGGIGRNTGSGLTRTASMKSGITYGDGFTLMPSRTR